MNTNHYDVIIIGAGAAGMMAASQAGKRGKSTLLLDHTDKIGKKIRISGGGRCNFTNINASSKNYISQNPHFAKSALARYTQHDFISLVESYDIAYHEKTLGQLFCDGSAQQIIDMMLDQCRINNVAIKQSCIISDIQKNEHFQLTTSSGPYSSNALIIATGGLSIPKIGATDFSYRIAKQFGLKIIPTKPALAPLHVDPSELHLFTDLSGVSNDSIVSYQDTSFRENILFTHKGLSGPAILQISSYLPIGVPSTININLLPNIDLKQELLSAKNTKKTPADILKNFLPKRLLAQLTAQGDFNISMANLKKERIFAVADKIHSFKALIYQTGGYAKAEVTAGGVDTNELSSKTLETKKVPGLYFIGESTDVTGWLGGYNFQWAWASGHAAGNAC